MEKIERDNKLRDAQNCLKFLVSVPTVINM